MGKIKIFSTITAILLLVACKKIEVPDPVFGDPVFTLDGQVDGENVSLIAGDDNYYMFTSTTIDTNGIHEFVGHLQLENCNGCGPAIKIRIRDEAVRTAQEVDIESALQAGDYAFFTNDSNIAEINYQASFTSMHSSSGGATPISYHWDFGDGASSNEANPMHVYPDDSDRVVGLEIQDDQNCTSFYEGTVSFYSQNVCNVDFTIAQVQQQFLQIQSMATGAAPFSYEWNTGETTANLITPIQVDSVPYNANFCLTIYDSMGCSASRCRSVYYLDPVGGNVGFCKTDFSVETNTDTLFQFDPLQFSSVIVEYTDPQGQVFRSDLGDQSPGTHSFQIQSVEDFMDNEDGLPTKKLDLRFSCSVYDEDGAAVELRNVRSDFAVGYPRN